MFFFLRNHFDSDFVAPLANWARRVSVKVIDPRNREENNFHASWYLTPERHITEMTFLTPLFIFLLWRSRRRTTSFPNKAKERKKNFYYVPTWFRFLFYLNYAVTVGYKVVRPDHTMKAVLCLFNPCHVFNLLGILFCWCNEYYRRRAENSDDDKEKEEESGSCYITPDFLLNCLFNLQAKPFIAALTPDTRHLHLPGETEFFYICHYLAMAFIPLLLYLNRDNKMKVDDDHFHWCIKLFSAEVLLYFDVIFFFSIMYGVNIIYMMSPPTPLLFMKENYRLGSLVLMFATHWVGRGIAVSAFKIIQRMKEKNKRKSD